ncbi:MAG: hypothetical protein LBT75_03775 [Bacilli bacterium]|jgi:metal-responsive CopG/Arc/MetJ family transcriptional regulator|nr:hypothetical protein [Bacilli bacterium]
MSKVLISINEEKLKKLNTMADKDYDGNRSRCIVALAKRAIELEEEYRILKDKFMKAI